jgi:D-alanyl-D-alanine carboxypeptidase
VIARPVALVLLTLTLVGPSAGTVEAGVPGFSATIKRIDEGLRDRTVSWRRSCPVPLRDLRLVSLTHWGFDGTLHSGLLTVHAHEAPRIVRAMRAIHTARFPIRRMRLVDAYRADDDRSMATDNTSAFNCRLVEGSARWSEHAYGRAIDINPLENPYVSGSNVAPPRGRPFANRSRRVPGMIHGGDAVVRAFAEVGWRWGGYWTSSQDYQHFSPTGR